MVWKVCLPAYVGGLAFAAITTPNMALNIVLFSKNQFHNLYKNVENQFLEEMTCYTRKTKYIFGIQN